MRGSVARLGFAVALAFPISAYAQVPARKDSVKAPAAKNSAKTGPATDSLKAPTTKDLVGKWEGIPGVDPKTERGANGKITTYHSIVLRSDGSWDEALQGDQEGCIGGKWRVVGDTALFDLDGEELSYKITMKKQQFHLFMWDDLTSPSEAYQRVDSTVKPVPSHIAMLDRCTKERTGQPPPATP